MVLRQNILKFWVERWS